MAGLMLFTNNAATTLATGITNVATSLTVASGTGALFPAPGAGEYFFMTLANNAGTVEIVKCTARTTDTLTIVRAQDGTSAVAWNSGDKVELRLVRADLLNFGQLDSTNTWTGAQTFSALSPNLPVFTNGSDTLTNTGVSPIANGGTNNGSLGVVAGGIYYGDGTKLMETAAGTAGQVLQSNGASAPTWAAPAISGNQMALTASGSIALGKVVLQQADNTVIQMTGTNQAQGTGQLIGGALPADTIQGIEDLTPVSATDTAGTTIVSLVQLVNSGTLQIRAGTISGTTITWGTAVTLTTTTNQNYVSSSITFDPTSAKWVVWYLSTGTSVLAARTVTVTGTTISLGTAVNLSIANDSSGLSNAQASYDVASGKHLLAYVAVTTFFPTVIVLTVSGTTVSYGTPVTMESAASPGFSLPVRAIYDTLSSRNFVIFAASGNVVKATMVTVSGTSATIGALVNTGIPATQRTFGSPDDYDFGNKTCQIFIDTARSRYVILNTSPITSGSTTFAFSSKEYTLSGTTLSYSTDVNYSNIVKGTDTRVNTALYDSNNNVLTLCFNNTVTYYKYLNTGSNLYDAFASSTNLATANAATVYEQWCGVIKLTATSYALTTQFLIDTAGTGTAGLQGYVTILTPATSNRNLGEIYGVSNGTYTNGQTANIVYKNSGYYVSGLTGLTINRDYYFDVSNTLSTSATNNTIDGLTLRSLSTTQLQVI